MYHNLSPSILLQKIKEGGVCSGDVLLHLLMVCLVSLGHTWYIVLIVCVLLKE